MQVAGDGALNSRKAPPQSPPGGGGGSARNKGLGVLRGGQGARSTAVAGRGLTGTDVARLKVGARLEQRRRRAARSKAPLDLLTWTILHRRWLGPDKLFDLKRHRYTVDIFHDDAQEIVVCKAGQMTVSEYALSWMLWSADVRKATGLYVFPTDTHVSDFSAARLGPAIEARTSPYLAELVVAARNTAGQRGADRVGYKRIGDGDIYFRGGKVQKGGAAPQLHSVDADCLVLDERDQMDKRVEALARQRLGHSAIGEIRIVSTPTFANVGIHAAYLASDQRTWHVSCTSCGRWQDLVIEDLVVESDDLGRPLDWHRDALGKPFLACRVCGGKLDRLGPGRWVAAYPGRRVHGYHLSRLFAAHRTLEQMLADLDTVDESQRQQAVNQGLGLPYRSPSSMSLDDTTLDKCRRDYGLGVCAQTSRGAQTSTERRGAARVTCGVDVGSKLHVVIRELMESGERQARFIGEVDGFADVGQLMRLHGVDVCVVDALPETRAARTFQGDWPKGVVWLAYYTTPKVGSKDPAAVSWNEEKGTATLARTRTLDATLAAFATSARGEPGNTLPANARDIQDYYAQLKAPERVFQDGADGNRVAVYVESGPDHYAHAENYNLAAEGAPRPPRPQGQSQTHSARGMFD